MPPKRVKKAAAPATPALDGCKITLSGTFPGLTQASIKTKAEALGATVASAVTDDTTHLVATEADFNKPSPKVTKAQSLGIHIVSLEWLSLSEKNDARESEQDHAHGAPTPAAPAQTDASKSASSQTNGTTNGTVTTTSRTRKRAPPPAAGNASDTETAPKPKKARGKAAAAAAVKSEEDDDAEMQDADAAEVEPKEEKGKAKAERSMGEGQVAKDKNMQIPLDEGCTFLTSKVYIDDAGVIYDASLNQTNASNNNNKFYRIQVRSSALTHPLVPVV